MFHEFDWVPVFQTTDETEAQVVAGALESNGIMARVHQAAHALTLLVDARDYEQAAVVVTQPVVEVQ